MYTAIITISLLIAGEPSDITYKLYKPTFESCVEAGQQAVDAARTSGYDAAQFRCIEQAKRS